MKCGNFQRRAALVKHDPVQAVEDAVMALWHDVAVAVARAEAARDPQVPTKWANAAVKGYLETLTEIREARNK